MQIIRLIEIGLTQELSKTLLTLCPLCPLRYALRARYANVLS